MPTSSYQRGYLNLGIFPNLVHFSTNFSYVLSNLIFLHRLGVGVGEWLIFYFMNKYKQPIERFLSGLSGNGRLYFV